MKPAARRIAALVAFPLLIIAAVAPLVVWHDELWKVFASVRQLREWVAGWGPAAPFIFMALQALQVVIFAIPGEVVQIGGGYLFGGWLGTLLATVGTIVGATIAFFLARLLGKPFVTALFSGERLEKIEKLLSSRSAKSIFFLLFLIPGIPKDILCYVGGISPLRFVFFITASTLGRLPGLIGSAVIGGAAASSRWVLLGIVSFAALALFTAGLLLRPKLQQWFERIAEKRKPSTGS